MSKPSACFFDLDGTLVYRDLRGDYPREVFRHCASPSERDADAIRRMVEAGNLAFICTGRAPVNFPPELMELPWSGMVTLYGGYVTLGDQVLRDDPFTEEQLNDLLLGLEGCHGNACIVGKDDCIETYDGIPGLGNWEKVVTIEDAHRVSPGNKFYKVFLDYDAGEAILDRPIVRDEFLYMPGLGGGLPWSEFCPVANDKMLGIKLIMEALGDSVGTTYGFGDSDLDLPLLRQCDVAVSVANATDVLKAESDYVTLSVQESGCAAALEHFGLCG